MQKGVTDWDAFLNLIIEKITEEKAILVQKVQTLEDTLAMEQKQREQNINHRNDTHLQNITELQSSLKLHEEQEKAVERESESCVTEQKQLLERVAQLEASLEFERYKWEEKNKKDQLDMDERINLPLLTIRELQDSLNHCEKKKDRAEHKRDHLMRYQKLLEDIQELQETVNHCYLLLQMIKKTTTEHIKHTTEHII
ncbi:hypothetical protein C0J50_12530 [Silurus asotus]|uniref:Uncharacterized protein n=1 Tax=Silurus asotus TaxID=30991 RepID=A0AAD4ZZ25_SILAS|nr:hypothetical protein C0J50_12530 [Silurus asotus]